MFRSALAAAPAAAVVALVAVSPAAAVTSLTFNFLTPGLSPAVNVASVTRGANERPDITLTATARRFSGIQPGALTALSQTVNNSTTTVRQQALGLGITGNGDTNQIDTNNNNFREAMLLTANRELRLTGFTLSMVDANDTVAVYGVRGDALTFLGFPGILAGGLDGSANVVTTGSGGSRISVVTLNSPSQFFDGFLFTTRVNGATQFMGNTGQGYRLDSVRAMVPEPATWAMLVLGFGLVGGAMRRRTVVRVLN